jgi:hypothetical protein
MRTIVVVIAVVDTGQTKLKLFASIAAWIEGTAESASFNAVEVVFINAGDAGCRSITGFAVVIGSRTGETLAVRNVVFVGAALCALTIRSTLGAM